MTDATIVITNHNYGRFLDAALSSAVGQRSDADVQVIVVDDGSTDRSNEVLAGWQGTVDIIRQPNRGQAAAFNAGFAASRGDVVVFLDADDLLFPGAVATVIAALDAHPDAARLLFPLLRIDSDGHPLGGTIPHDPRDLPSGSLVHRVLSAPDDIPWQPTSGNAFRARTLQRALPMPEDPYRTSADHFLSNVTALDGDIVAVEEALGAYRIHGANADHRERFDIDRISDIVERTVVTHRALHDAATERALPFPRDPLAIPSVTFLAGRLLLRRLSPTSGPTPSDRCLSLAVRGIVAAARRADAPPLRRLLMAAWFVAAVVSPRWLVPRLGALALTR